MTQLCGGIEDGGTKFVCAVGSGPEDLRDEMRFPTTTPQDTINRAIAYVKGQAEAGALRRRGAGRQRRTFGLRHRRQRRGPRRVPTGRGAGLDILIDFTIGTGIGGGMVSGRLIHGLVHLEIDYIRISHDGLADLFPDSCPDHGDCLEGLA